ncbi:serine/threonine protein kinase [Novipirellula artificiosorum]|uniref:Serine/threonine-protein kinase PknB n=1 Tax=Novipirellula artificiosorum TaxID=2528016 RepID=A0A5C6D6K6_9BACT|nr:serine/threonine-protein kinase [Novipirellula artificiosorum]TWU30876.1 Serine/threonine-protein kinase PknB [Novipirellula artificiosorum]
MTQLNCPQRDQLTAFLQGQIAAGQASLIGEHLDVCDECRALIDTISDNSDTLVSALARPKPINEYANESAFARVESLIQAVGREPSLLKASQNASSVDENAEKMGQIGQYELLAKLGEGGMGAVYKALHTRLKKVVALKVLPENRLRDTRAVARFEREMEAVGRLEHVNIVRAMDANVYEGNHYLVIEYVDGVDLADLVRTIGPLPIADACELIRQAAIGLQHAHEHSLVHRDIKPSNIMLSSEGQVKILDLGLARLHNGQQDELTSKGQMMGTLDYMAPEQTGHSHDVDIRADIYSLGATLYKLLCGHAPYSHPRYDTAVKKLAALAIEPIPPIEELRSEVPDRLATAVHKMLAKEADERFATPIEVVDALTPLTEAADLNMLFARFATRSSSATEESNASWLTGQPTENYLSNPMTETQSNAADANAALSPPTTVETLSDRHDRASKLQPEPAPALAVSSSTSDRNRRPRVLVATAMMGFGAFLAAVMIIRLATDKGEITIQSFDPQVEVTVKRNGEVVDGFQIAQRPDGTSYYSGQYEIVIKDPQWKSDEISVKNGTFKLSRGDTVLVEIVRKEGVVSTPVADPANDDLDRKVAEAVLKQGFDGLILVLKSNGEERRPVPGDALPDPSEPFFISYLSVKLAINDSSDLLSDIGRLSHLNGLNFYNTGAPQASWQDLSPLSGLTQLEHFSRA